MWEFSVDQTTNKTLGGQDSGQTSKPTSTVDKSKQRSRPVRKNEMPPMKDEELVLGATFTGKLSEGYVKDVSSVVSVGQEVKVKLLEANIETGRITLTMRENESSKNTGQKSNPRRDRDEGRKSIKFVKGQELEGAVKNLTFGCFYKPIGRRGRVFYQVLKNLTFGCFYKDLDSKLQGKVFTATNPFLIAFRENKDIASFLDDREKVDGEDVKSSGNGPGWVI
ncbi:putative translation elongation factor EFTs/EF1B, S1 domain, nucleic acid-binding protein [Helianthus annuus]|nr:putative translation elongation factor EFTs/EF1B, S1 domain, nucleic acid-binding protein [Helianthus annuus]